MKFEKKYISEVICLVQYRVIDAKIRHQVADAENAFSGMFSGQSQQTNVPDETDPNIPRLIFQAGQKQLSISQKACQLNLHFENNEKTIDEQLEIIKKNLLTFQKDLLKFKSEEMLGECAIVIGINVPCTGGKGAMLRHLYNRFFKFDQQAEFGELASYSYKVGYRTSDDLYLNYEADVYELRKFELPKPTLLRQVVRFEAKDGPLIEEGIGFRVDINNKLKATSATYTFIGVNELLPLASDFIASKIDKLIGLSDN